MKKSILLAIFFGLAISAASLAQTKDKFALLIGVTKYQHGSMNDSPLKYPEADAKAVAELLKKSGYTVDLILGKKATSASVQAALKRASQEGTDDGVVMVGLFGHGVQYGQKAYYAPFDTKLRIVKDSRGNTIREKNGSPKLEPDPESMVEMRQILDTLTVCGAQNRVLLADCCRNDPSAARGRAFGTTLTTSDLPSGTVAMFACSENQKAFEHDDWKHGAFTYAFLENAKQLSKTGRVLSGALSDNLFVSVDELVKDVTNGSESQTVYAFSSGTVDFKLVDYELTDRLNGLLEKSKKRFDVERKAHAALTEEERGELYPPAASDYIAEIVSPAMLKTNNPVVCEAIVWAVKKSEPVGCGGEIDNLIDALIDRFDRDEWLADVCWPISEGAPNVRTERFLKRIENESGDAFVKATAIRSLINLYQRARTYAEDDDDESSEAWLEIVADAKAISVDESRIEALYQKLIDEYGDIKAYTKGETLCRDYAKGGLFQMRKLVVGKTVPDIQGKDTKGKEFKLSDYRGEIVLLDFWGDW